MYSIMYVHMYSVQVKLMAVNGSNITGDKREELGIFCYNNILALTVKHYVLFQDDMD